MSNIITSPFTVFFDRSGQPLDAGYIYIGTAGINPEVSPITVYWDDTVPVTAAQPIRTLAGYASRDGSPGTIIGTQATYSIVVRDRTGALVYSDLNATTGANAIPETIASIAALRLLTATTVSTQVMLVANYVAGDGGGVFRYDSTDTTTADNGGTVIVDAAGKRWKRQFDAGEAMTLEMFGGGPAVSSNTAAFDAWVAAVIAGTASRTLDLGTGTYAFLTKTNRIDNAGEIIIRGQGVSSVVTRGWTSSSFKEALFHVYGSTQISAYDFAAGTAAGGSYGGSLITLEASSSAAPDFSLISHIYSTSYSGAVTKTISAATAATPAVFTSAAHGYANGTFVVYLYGTGGTWSQLTHRLFQISDAATNTFTLTDPDTATKVDSSGFGVYSANSASVKEALCTDYPLVIDGSARTTGAVGVRNIKLENLTFFGGRRGAILINGTIECGSTNVSTSDAGWDATVRVTGTASVPNYYNIFSSGSLARVALDRSYYAGGNAQIQGQLVQTANTYGQYWNGSVGNTVTRLGAYVAGPDFIPLPGGMVFQRKVISGVTAAYVTFTWPVVFSVAPVLYAAQPYGSASTAANAIVNAASTTGVDVAGQNLSGGGDVIIWAIGELAY